MSLKALRQAWPCLSEAGGHTEVMATQSRGPAVCQLPCQDRVQESISLFFKNKNKTKNG